MSETIGSSAHCSSHIRERARDKRAQACATCLCRCARSRVIGKFRAIMSGNRILSYTVR